MSKRRQEVASPNGEGDGNCVHQSNGGAEGGGSLNISRRSLSVGRIKLPELPTSMDTSAVIERARAIDAFAKQLMAWVPKALDYMSDREAALADMRDQGGGTAVEVFLELEQTEGTPEYKAAQDAAEAERDLDLYLHREKVVQWKRAAQVAYMLYHLGYVVDSQEQFQVFRTFADREEALGELRHLVKQQLLFPTPDGSGQIRAYGICYRPDPCLNDKSIALIQEKLEEAMRAVGRKQAEEERRKGTRLFQMSTVTAKEFVSGAKGTLAFGTNGGVVVLESDGRNVRPVRCKEEDGRVSIAATGRNAELLEEAIRTGATLLLGDMGGTKPPSASMPRQLSWLRFTGKKGKYINDWKSQADELRSRATLSVSAFLSGKPGTVFLALAPVQNSEGKWLSSGAVLLKNKDGNISVEKAIGPISEALAEVEEHDIFLRFQAVRSKEEPFSQVETETNRLVNLLWTVVKCGLFEVCCRRVTTLWYLCKDIEPLLLKEQAETSRQEWLQRATITPQEFFLGQKPGICLVSVESDWHDKERSRRIPNLFALVERRETQKGYVIVLLEVPGHVPSDFMGGIVGQEFADTEKFADVPVPLKLFLQAAHGLAAKADGIVSQTQDAVAATSPDSK